MKIKDQIDKLLISGRPGEAIDMLMDYARHEDEGMYNTLILLKSRYEKNEKDNNMGIITRDDYQRTQAQITYSFLQIMKDISEDEPFAGKSNSVNVSGSGNFVFQNTRGSTIRIGGSEERKEKEKILFVSAGPSGMTQLRTNKESREIQEGLQRANNRESFNFEMRLATRAKDLARAILDENPQFLHFAGHGQMDGIVLEDDQGNAKTASTEAISNLFGLFSDTLKCVFLNSCYSEIQAREISKHVSFVIGMSAAVPDTTAIAFATGFYDAIGAGRDIEFAFNFAKTGISLEGLTGEQIPVLRCKKKNHP